MQYGLPALQQGLITPAMFLDLNSKIGGLSVDIMPTVQRRTADQPALANAYRSGMINEANNYDQTAIIDRRGPIPAWPTMPTVLSRCAPGSTANTARTPTS